MYIEGGRSMNIIIRNNSTKPIYEQIKEQFMEQIVKGELREGEKLPSIRFLAKELRISVITTKRAYDELERDGFINSVQGKGSFVAIQNEELIKEENLRKIEKSLKEVLYLASVTGITRKELVEMMELLEAEDE